MGRRRTKSCSVLHIVKMDSISGSHTRLVVQSLGETINVYIARGQTKATSYFSTLSQLKFNTALPSLSNRERDSKMFMLGKKICYFIHLIMKKS